MSILLKILICLSHFLLSANASREEAERFLYRTLTPSLSKACFNINKAHFEFRTDLMNESKSEAYINATLEMRNLERNLYNELFAMDMSTSFSSVKSRLFDRQIIIAFSKHLSLKNRDFTDKITRDYVEAERNYGSARICPVNRPNCQLPDEGFGLTDVMNILSTSTNYNELVHVWKAWRDVTGKRLKWMYQEYIQMEQKNEKELDKINNGQIEDAFAAQNLKRLQPLRMWKELKPLYTELHKYVAKKLKAYYKDELDISDGLAPAHVFGSIFGENWQSIERLVKPFPNVSDGGVEQNLKRRFKVADMFKAVDEFHQSLGLKRLEKIYNDSEQMIFEPEDGRQVNCYPAVFDLCNGTYRLSMCAELNMENFRMIHRVLGRIQYFEQYYRLPYLFREGATSFIEESIGDVIALSALSPIHLRKLELITDHKETYETSINYLMKMALQKVAFLPFGLIVDLWRWDVMEGKVPQEELNSHWWKYRKEFQLMKPPVARSDETDFDMGAMYHIVAGDEYMPYYFAYVAQFQIFKNLCWKAHLLNPVDFKVCPLYHCDFFNSVEVGKLLQSALQVGRLKNWTDVFYTLSGSKGISVDPLLEYFQPLYEYLLEENMKPDEISPPEQTSHTFLIILTFLLLISISGSTILYFKYKRWIIQRYRALFARAD